MRASNSIVISMSKLPTSKRANGYSRTTEVTLHHERLTSSMGNRNGQQKMDRNHSRSKMQLESTVFASPALHLVDDFWSRIPTTKTPSDDQSLWLCYEELLWCGWQERRHPKSTALFIRLIVSRLNLSYWKIDYYYLWKVYCTVCILRCCCRSQSPIKLRSDGG